MSSQRSRVQIRPSQPTKLLDLQGLVDDLGRVFLFAEWPIVPIIEFKVKFGWRISYCKPPQFQLPVGQTLNLINLVPSCVCAQGRIPMTSLARVDKHAELLVRQGEGGYWEEAVIWGKAPNHLASRRAAGLRDPDRLAWLLR